MAVMGLLAGAGFGIYAKVNGDSDPPMRHDGSTIPATAQAPADSALARFAEAEQLVQDGRPQDAHAALLEAVRLYDELIRRDPDRHGPALAPAVLRALGGMGVDFSVPEADLLDWLSYPEHTPYAVLSQALLQSGWRLKHPVHLDVIWWNYQQTPGATVPRQAADVRPDLLKAAILQGSNARHGTQIKDFAQLIH